MRAFLALPIPEETAAALCRAQGQIPFRRPVPEDNLHLTLAFLGDVGEARLSDLDAALSISLLPAVPVRFGGLGTFAEMERGLVFAEVLADPALLALQARVMRLVRDAGLDLPRRRFRPHVTLVRSARQPRGPARDRLAATLGLPMSIPDFMARELVLFRSTLGSGGARHDALARYPLSPFAA